MRSYLIVDDSLPFAENLEEILRDQGDEAVVANSGSSALELVRNKRFHALITDMKMPTMNGTKLVQEIHRVDPELPVIIVTAYSAEAELRRAKQEGVFAILPKPVPLDELLPLLAKARRNGLAARAEDDLALAENLAAAPNAGAALPRGGEMSGSPAAPEQPAPRASGPAARILVVDDNLPLVENVAEILLDAGYEVKSAGSCTEALRRAADGFDVALMDLRLPDGEGTAFATSLKESYPDCEIVLMTGFATIETAIAAVRAGAFAYLVKPCTTPELLRTIEQALRYLRLQAEKRALAHRAQTAEKLAAVGTLTAGLSHEIRNPLNAAALQLSVLERRLERLPAETRGELLEPLGLVKDEIRRLDHILEDFLQFARPRELIAGAVDLPPLVGRVLDLLEGEAKLRSIRLERNLTPVPQVAGDEGRLRQVVMNLSINALEAVNEAGRVKVSTAHRDREVQLIIEDTGPGIPPQIQARLFEPFFTTKAGGSGLGLPIVNAIVTQHGGSIAFEEGIGGGARFIVTLPAMRPQ